MKTILDLFLASGAEDVVPKNLMRFAALAELQDLEFRRLVVTRRADGTVDMQELLDQVLQAQGFWIYDPGTLADTQILEAVKMRLKEGAVAIAHLKSAASPSPGMEIFEDLGLLATSIRASCPDGTPSPYGHPMLVVADRETYEPGFRDSTLFQGVDRLLLQQANGIGYQGGAQSVLALPVEAIDPIDMETDWAVCVPRPELTVIASTAERQWLGCRVFAMHAGIVHDSYVGPFGNLFPGIEGEDNETFARNLLSTVAGARGPQLSWETARSIAIQFETAIAQLLRAVLANAHGPDWFERAAPEKVKIKCHEDWIRKGRAATPQSYLNLIQFIELFKSNWAVIGSALATAGCNMTLSEAKSAISQVTRSATTRCM